LQIAHPALNTSTLRLMASHASARLIITNAPGTIGGFVSHGCIRMYNEDITVRIFEGEAAETRPAILAALRRALELAGVEFIDENGGGIGVRYRKRQRSKPR
jgi:hypothetical protein